MKKIIVVGSGFSSLSVASYLAQAGYHVAIFEKNDTPWELDNSKKTGLLLILGRLGIGCQTFLNLTLGLW